MVDSIYLYSDEAGDFDFRDNQNVSNYFIICTVVTKSLEIVSELITLRHSLVRDGHVIQDYFHASEEKQAVRDLVFETILRHDFQVQAQICEKRKAYAHVKESKSRFYKYPWYYLMKHGVSAQLKPNQHLYATAASIGTNKERATYINNLADVIRQNTGCSYSVDFRRSMADPCLQVADYCTWAIQRKWEIGDTRSYDLIKDRITYEYDLWNYNRVR